MYPRSKPAIYKPDSVRTTNLLIIDALKIEGRDSIFVKLKNIFLKGQYPSDAAAGVVKSCNDQCQFYTVDVLFDSDVWREKL